MQNNKLNNSYQWKAKWRATRNANAHLRNTQQWKAMTHKIPQNIIQQTFLLIIR